MSKNTTIPTSSTKPTQQQAQDAVKTLISWAGDNPNREGLLETPKRVVNAYLDFFSGYTQDPIKVLGKTFEEVGGYNDLVLINNIRVESHCEHHMVPIIGQAFVAYLPNNKVVGISKIARLVEIFAKRLQTQETMTAQIANTINEVLNPKGVAVLIDAFHQCMTTRGVHKTEASTVTCTFLGQFQTDKNLETRFFNMIKK
ncbi:MAG: GTP cyclohydrolase I FolE [Proteobacteria bacterium]|jgi:GTP cyclohydrolase I|nr:GTP cyclohydrolase I FolE [Pseudomonadota bacterium]